jgi:CheY-like chemotaxis protein
MISLHGSTGGPATESLPAIAPVLVVDDDGSGAAETETILAGNGYLVTTETRGDEVLALVRASLVRMVVSEIYIPCSEGPCLVTALKMDRTRLPRLRILVYTRHSQPADVEWALAAGADTIVRKPAPHERLVGEVSRLVGEPS